MLGKLIKNDLKFGMHSVSLVYLAALIASAVMGISMLMSLDSVKYVSSIAFVAAAFTTIIVTVFAIIINFQKTMYGSQGYLTQTLPVKTPMLLFSKWFTSFFWVFLSQLFFYVSIVVMYYYFSGGSSFKLIESIVMSAEGIIPEASVIKKLFVIEAVKWIFNVGVFAVFVLFGITLANVRPFHALGGAGAVIYTFAMFIISNLLGKGVKQLFDISVTASSSELSLVFTEQAAEAVVFEGGHASSLTGLLTSVVLGVVLFAFMLQLIEKKINIK